MNFLSDLTRLLIPAPCLLCRMPTLSSNGLCPQCDAVWGDLSTRDGRCPVCAIRVPEPDMICADCLRHPRSFDRTVTGLDFDAPARALIHRLKFQRDTAVMAALLRPMIDAIGQHYPRSPAALLPEDWPDALLPMPIHPRRRRERGFNQARLMADRLGRHFGLSVCGDAVRRVKMNAPQSQLDAAARRKSLKDAFAVEGALPAHVAIVDDVMTTGSTTDSLARVLKRAGVFRVSVWVAARTPRPGG
ncbi:MAG TPA: ComF family protein [Halothiobacillus sp.]|nr:ComF family protein [Halothiobacillus sp.]